MANIEKMLQQQRELEKKIQEQKEKVYYDFGKELINTLEIPFDLIGSKKDIQNVAEEIKNNLGSDLFEISNDNEDNVEDQNNSENSNDELNTPASNY